jgi:hypothetical protein
MGYVSSLTTNTVNIEGYGTATGGTGVTAVTISGVNYEYTSFTSSGTLTVTKSGLFDVMLCGGGGGGGNGDANGVGGGGGAGQILQDTVYLSANVSFVVGAGGSGSGQGSASYSDVIYDLVAAGGAWGGSYSTADRKGVGGSGGGAVCRNDAAWYNANGVAIASAITGHNGGTAPSGTNTGGAGGGGGAGAVGVNGTSTVGGNGGAGYDVSAFIGGSSLFKAGGGGGGRGSTGTTVGSGGSSIGGSGGANTNGSSASANTASGGGGAGNSGTGGSGGSGIIYVRWKV